jgi:hypothetical protein
MNKWQSIRDVSLFIIAECAVSQSAWALLLARRSPCTKYSDAHYKAARTDPTLGLREYAKHFNRIKLQTTHAPKFKFTLRLLKKNLI